MKIEYFKKSINKKEVYDMFIDDEPYLIDINASQDFIFKLICDLELNEREIKLNDFQIIESPPTIYQIPKSLETKIKNNKTLNA